MSALFDELTTKARNLSQEERLRLSEWLLDTVDGFAPEAEQAWAAVVAERLARLDAGEATLPATDVLAEMKRRFG